MDHALFKPATCLALALALALCATCAPLKTGRDAGDGTFEVSSASLYEQTGEFSLLDEAVYPELGFRPFDSRINVTNKYLTLADATHESRCTRCHECGFERAWDMEDYDTDDWDPRYVGEQWRPVVQRMRLMENSLINETIADRIYSFLRDETLGTYDESKDAGDTVIREIDPEDMQPAVPRRPRQRPR